MTSGRGRLQRGRVATEVGWPSTCCTPFIISQMDQTATTHGRQAAPELQWRSGLRQAPDRAMAVATHLGRSDSHVGRQDAQAHHLLHPGCRVVCSRLTAALLALPIPSSGQPEAAAALEGCSQILVRHWLCATSQGDAGNEVKRQRPPAAGISLFRLTKVSLQERSRSP